MNSSPIPRRQFLKSLSLLPLVPLLRKSSPFIAETNSLPQSQGIPNVLILVFDALCAAHMSLYGYHRETTPYLTRFAERATVYHAHYAGGNFTTPGTSSLLTGTYPWTHRAFNLAATVAENYKHRHLFRAFAGETYNRIAYTHNLMANLFLYQFRGDLDVYVNPSQFSLFQSLLFDQVFPNDANIAYRSEDIILDANRERRSSLFLSLMHEIRGQLKEESLRREFVDLYPRGLPEIGNSFFLLEQVIYGLKEIISSSRQPFVAYFHLYPPHEPYRPRREFVGRFDDGWVPEVKAPHFFSKEETDKYLRDCWREYDEYIAYADAEFGRLYDFMAQTGLLNNTYVVFTSDHGQLFERGIHGHNTPVLYESLVRIPLLVAKPKQQQREDVYAPTSCVDVLPTLLQVTGQPIPDWCEGEVLPPFDDKQASSERSIFSVEAKSNPKQTPLTKATVALVKGQYKLIHYFGYDGYEDEYELYGLANDPEELENLYTSKQSVAAELQSELVEKLQAVNQM